MWYFQRCVCGWVGETVYMALDVLRCNSQKNVSKIMDHIFIIQGLHIKYTIAGNLQNHQHFTAEEVIQL